MGWEAGHRAVDSPNAPSDPPPPDYGSGLLGQDRLAARIGQW
jgi:hypothetical protein